MTAQRVGARVPDVIAAGPAGPARDALLVTTPPIGRLLSTFTPFPTENPETATGTEDGSDTIPTPPAAAALPIPVEEIHDGALDSIFEQVTRAPGRWDRPRLTLDRDHRGG